MSEEDEELKEAWRAFCEKLSNVLLAPKEMNFFDTDVVLPLNVF